jgi:hypothetical protein
MLHSAKKEPTITERLNYFNKAIDYLIDKLREADEKRTLEIHGEFYNAIQEVNKLLHSNINDEEFSEIMDFLHVSATLFKIKFGEVVPIDYYVPTHPEIYDFETILNRISKEHPGSAEEYYCYWSNQIYSKAKPAALEDKTKLDSLVNYIEAQMVDISIEFPEQQNALVSFIEKFDSPRKGSTLRKQNRRRLTIQHEPQTGKPLKRSLDGWVRASFNYLQAPILGFGKLMESVVFLSPTEHLLRKRRKL